MAEEIQERLKQIAERVRMASTGPWKVGKIEDGLSDWLLATFGESSDGHKYTVTTDRVHATEMEGDARTDAEFCANARQDIPWLLNLIKELGGG